ncbi:type II secretion system F family protein [Liberibacter sp. Z1]|nr:type II secretion system F family protein [Candidatus Liberibacter sp.]
MVFFAFVGLSVCSLVALYYAVFYDKVASERKSSSRITQIKSGNSGPVTSTATRRRKELREIMDKMEQERKLKTGNSSNIRALISHSGLPITREYFYIASAVLGFLIFVILYITVNSSFIIIFLAAISAGLIVPRMFLKYIIKRRQAKFLEEFPNSLDIIIRAVRSGLPVSDSIKIIVSQSSDPVRAEFRRITESQQLGLSVSESVARMMRYMPLREVAFFSTVITIQAQSGGNLSEALSNLSRVLRDRKKMKGKVKAMAMEAKASAWIIGSLPFIVSSLVYFTSPQYMSILFIDPRGNMLLGIAAVLMVFGIVVMRLMINFDM